MWKGKRIEQHFHFILDLRTYPSSAILPFVSPP